MMFGYVFAASRRLGGQHAISVEFGRQTCLRPPVAAAQHDLLYAVKYNAFYPNSQLTHPS
jgi:hypothetical protein